MVEVLGIEPVISLLAIMYVYIHNEEPSYRQLSSRKSTTDRKPRADRISLTGSSLIHHCVSNGCEVKRRLINYVALSCCAS